MKQIFKFALLLIAPFLVACGGSGASATATAEAFLKAYQAGDAAKAVTYYDNSDKPAEEIEMMEGKYAMMITEESEEHGKLTSYTLIEEEIKEDGQVDMVYELTFEDGETENRDFSAQEIEGKWVLVPVTISL